MQALNGPTWGAFGFPSLGVSDPLAALRLKAIVWLDASDRYSMRQDSAGTVPVSSFGDPVGRLSGRSGNVYATQDAAGKRPLLSRLPKGGVRNLLNTSEDWIDNSGISGITVAPDASADPNGAMTFDVLNNSTDPNDRIYKRSPVSAVNGNTYTASVVLNIAGCTSSTWSLDLGKGSEHRVLMEFNPLLLPGGVTTKDTSNGTLWDIVDHGYQDLGGGFVRIWVVGRAVNLSSNLLEVALWNRDIVAGETLSVGRVQIEEGNTATAYQRRTSITDVTEQGVRSLSGLFHDQTDDEMTVTLPDLGTDATEFWADSSGVSISTGITIGAGARTLPTSERLFAYGVFDRALTAQETSQLQTFLSIRAGV